MAFKSLNLLCSMKAGISNTVLSNLWNFLCICRYHEKIQENSGNVQIWDFFFFYDYLVHFYTKIISLGMWSEHNAPCLLVLLNEFITYIYLYTHLYAYVCIGIYVLKFRLLYLITECGFLIQWCLLADKNNQKWILFVNKSLWCISI